MRRHIVARPPIIDRGQLSLYFNFRWLWILNFGFEFGFGLEFDGRHLAEVIEDFFGLRDEVQCHVSVIAEYGGHWTGGLVWLYL